jgi:hypothetical protein
MSAFSARVLCTPAKAANVPRTPDYDTFGGGGGVGIRASVPIKDAFRLPACTEPCAERRHNGHRIRA